MGKHGWRQKVTWLPWTDSDDPTETWEGKLAEQLRAELGREPTKQELRKAKRRKPPETLPSAVKTPGWTIGREGPKSGRRRIVRGGAFEENRRRH